MDNIKNKGYDPMIIREYHDKMKVLDQSFLFDDEDERSEEYCHFYFIGIYEGKEVIYDTVLYTLRLQHESELFEIAEHRAEIHFPHYKIKNEEAEEENLETIDPLEEEIGLFMAEVIVELEEDEAVKVKEHADPDRHVDFGVVLDVGLHIEKITDQEIRKFIKDFNENNLKLDDTLYSFQTQETAE